MKKIFLFVLFIFLSTLGFSQFPNITGGSLKLSTIVDEKNTGFDTIATWKKMLVSGKTLYQAGYISKDSLIGPFRRSSGKVFLRTNGDSTGFGTLLPTAKVHIISFNGVPLKVKSNKGAMPGIVVETSSGRGIDVRMASTNDTVKPIYGYSQYGFGVYSGGKLGIGSAPKTYGSDSLLVLKNKTVYTLYPGDSGQVLKTSGIGSLYWGDDNTTPSTTSRFYVNYGSNWGDKIVDKYIYPVDTLYVDTAKNVGPGGTNYWTLKGDSLYPVSPNDFFVVIGDSVADPNAKLTLDGNMSVNNSFILYKDGNLYLHNTSIGNPTANNLFLGKASGNNTVTGNTGITAIGDSTLWRLNTGSANTAIGTGALKMHKTNSYNTAVGYEALNKDSIGQRNTAIGVFAAKQNIDGTLITAIGDKAFENSTSGDHVVAIGADALLNSIAGLHSVVVGCYAMGVNTTGHHNTAVGSHAGLIDTTGSYNVFLGYRSGDTERGSYKLYIETEENQTQPLIYGDFYNDSLIITAIVGVGEADSARLYYTLPQAGGVEGQILKLGADNMSLEWANDETGAGSSSKWKHDVVGHGLYPNHWQSDSVGINTNTPNNKFQVLGYITFEDVSKYNTYIGKGTGNNHITGMTNNTAIGYYSQYHSSSLFAKDNTSVGSQALLKGSGEGNTVVGSSAMISATTAQHNVAIGAKALELQTSGGSNTALGYNSMGKATTGGNTVAIGINSISANTYTGNNNIAIGTTSMRDVTTGTNSVAIGTNSLLSNTTGTGNIGIGYGSGVNQTPPYSNRLFIDNINSNMFTSLLYADMSQAAGLDTVVVNGPLTIGNGITRVYSLPTTLGTSNKVLGSDGSKTLKWLDVSAVGGGGYWNHTSNNLYPTTYLTDNVLVRTNTLPTGYGPFYVKDYFHFDDPYINTAIGYEALISVTHPTANDGKLNTAVGFQSQKYTSTGTHNTTIGQSTLKENTTGSNNTALGCGAIGANITGQGNTAVGSHAMDIMNSGSNNTAVGLNAGYRTNGNSNIFIGKEAGSDVTTPIAKSNEVFIEPSTADKFHAWLWGYAPTATTNDTAVFNAYLGVGQTNGDRAYFFPRTKGNESQPLTVGKGKVLRWGYAPEGGVVITIGNYCLEDGSGILIRNDTIFVDTCMGSPFYGCDTSSYDSTTNVLTICDSTYTLTWQELWVKFSGNNYYWLSPRYNENINLNTSYPYNAHIAIVPKMNQFGILINSLNQDNSLPAMRINSAGDLGLVVAGGDTSVSISVSQYKTGIAINTVAGSNSLAINAKGKIRITERDTALSIISVNNTSSIFPATYIKANRKQEGLRIDSDTSSALVINSNNVENTMGYAVQITSNYGSGLSVNGGEASAVFNNGNDSIVNVIIQELDTASIALWTQGKIQIGALQIDSIAPYNNDTILSISPYTGKVGYKVGGGLNGIISALPSANTRIVANNHSFNIDSLSEMRMVTRDSTGVLRVTPTYNLLSTTVAGAHGDFQTQGGNVSAEATQGNRSSKLNMYPKYLQLTTIGAGAVPLASFQMDSVTTYFETDTLDLRNCDIVKASLPIDTATYTVMLNTKNQVVKKVVTAGGSGTVTSLSQGLGMLNSADPITTTGTIGVDSTKVVLFNDTLTAGKIATKKWVTDNPPVAAADTGKVSTYQNDLLYANYTYRNSTATVGNIYKAGSLYDHNFGTRNTFHGEGSGNLTLSGTDNVGLGYNAFTTINGAIGSVAIGSYAANTANKAGSGWNDYGVAIGYKSLYSGDILNCVGIGAYAGYNNTIGGNVFIGNSSGYTSYTTPSLTYIGASAGYYQGNNIHGKNTAIGQIAMQGSAGSNTYYNTAIGFSSLNKINSGNSITAIGCESGYNLTSGGNSVAVGFQSLYSATTSYSNVAVGFQSLYSTNVSGTEGDNTALGASSGYTNSTGIWNTYIGRNSGYYNSSGSNNVCLGAYSGEYNTLSKRFFVNSLDRTNLAGDTTKSIIYGYMDATETLQRLTFNAKTYRIAPEYLNASLYDHNSGTRNTFHGALAGTLTISGNGLNAGYGSYSLGSISSGEKNTAMGDASAFSNSTGGSNVAIGYTASYTNTTSSNNVAVGVGALYKLNAGGATNNTAVGFNTLYNCTVGLNDAFGSNALNAHQNGTRNVAVGNSALTRSQTGNRNFAAGMTAGGYLVSGSDNVYIGDVSGGGLDAAPGSTSETATGNVAIGSYSRASAAVGNNGIAIGFNSGRYCNLGGRLFVNNQDRSTLAGDTTKSILYGYMDATASLQRLTVNGNLFTTDRFSLGTTNRNAKFNVIFPKTTDTLLVVRNSVTGNDSTFWVDTKGGINSTGDLKYNFIHCVGSADSLVSYSVGGTQNVYYKVNTTAFVSREADGISIIGDSIKILTAGAYRVDCWLAATTSNANDKVRVKLYINNAKSANSLGRWMINSQGTGNESTSAYSWYKDDFAANDYLSVRVANITGARAVNITDIKLIVSKIPE